VPEFPLTSAYWPADTSGAAARDDHRVGPARRRGPARRDKDRPDRGRPADRRERRPQRRAAPPVDLRRAAGQRRAGRAGAADAVRPRRAGRDLVGQQPRVDHPRLRRASPGSPWSPSTRPTRATRSRTCSATPGPTAWSWPTPTRAATCAPSWPQFAAGSRRCARSSRSRLDAFIAKGDRDGPLPAVARPTSATALHLGYHGRPKGALLTHRALTNNARLAFQRVGIGPDDVLVNPMPMFHVGGGPCSPSAPVEVARRRSCRASPRPEA